MAALYLHNAIHSQEPSNLSWNSSPHNRNVSAVSNATLQTSTSEYSHPTEPLLHSSTLESVAYLDLLSRQPTHPTERRAEWTASLSLDDDPVTSRERKSIRKRLLRQQLRRLKICKSLLEIMIGAFAVYNTVRYFLAYTIYDSGVGQTVALVMGISTGASFALLVCAVILSVSQISLLARGISLHFLLLTCTGLHLLASLLLFGPAVVNLVLLFMWKHSVAPELIVERRCHVDIDIIWSVSNAKCGPSSWGVWLTLTSIRLGLTFCILIFYHLISLYYDRIRRPLLSRSRRPRHIHGNPSESSLSPPMVALSSSSFVAPQRTHLRSQNRSSESTLKSHANSKYSLTSYLQTPGAVASSVYSEEVSADSDHDPNPEPLTTRGSGGSINNIGEEIEFDNFQDRFHSIVSQIARETEDGLELARSDSTSTPPQSTFGLPDDFYPPSVPPSLGYDEFGQPYPPDERVLILNGVVRRMPTIESMGSREFASRTVSSMYTDKDTIATNPNSRPSTRANTLSLSEYNMESRRPSRSNSVTTGVAISVPVGRTSEVGELLDRASQGVEVKGTSLTSSGGNTETVSSRPSAVSYYTALGYSSVGLDSERGYSPPPASIGYSDGVSEKQQKIDL